MITTRRADSSSLKIDTTALVFKCLSLSTWPDWVLGVLEYKSTNSIP